MRVLRHTLFPKEAAMFTIAKALRRIKGNLAQFLPNSAITVAAEHIDQPRRHRLLDPATTTYLFLQQLLHGNTAIAELQHLSGLDFTDSAYCQARARLPLSFFACLQQQSLPRCPQPRRWRGHRLFVLDGSSFSMPDTPALQEYFGQPEAQDPGCGFPSAHLLVLIEHSSGYLWHALASPYRTHDMAKAAGLHTRLQPGDLLLGDRAFDSYAHLALARQRRLHGLFRAHQKRLINFRPGRRHTTPTGQPSKGLPRSRWLKRLGKHDQLVEYFKPKKKPAWLSQTAYDALPPTLVVRELRMRIKVPGCRTTEITLVTTLTDVKRYSARALAKLYRCRWQVEVELRHLKQTLKLDVLRCRSVLGVLKELLLLVVLYNLVRRVLMQAAARQGVAPERLSFVDALRWLRWSPPGAKVVKLRINPDRPDRVEPRVLKRRPKPFSLLTQPRATLRKALLKQQPAP
jgi:hypothetical protein